MSFGLEVLSDEDWAENAANRFAEFDPARVTLATGKTMTPFLREIAKGDLSGVTVFLLDEYGDLPRDDPGRCESMIRRDLLDIAEKPPRVRTPAVDPPDPFGYKRLIDDGGLDLAVVGLGANGHIGMNEPGSTVDSPTRVVRLAASTAANAENYGAKAIPTWGLTIGMATLMEAREIWLLVTGEHKRGILQQVLADPIGPDLPATFLRNHQRCTVIADRSAAG